MIRQLAEENIVLLRQGQTLLRDLSDELYTCNENPYFTSGVGMHFRHIFDFYQAFFMPFGSRSALAVVHQEPELIRLDYDQRKRDSKLEGQRSEFLRASEGIISQLQGMTGDTPAGSSKNDVVVEVFTCEGLSGRQSRAVSSLARELQFLLGHTVHHYAIIALLLRIQGQTVPKNFGLARSTIEYYQGDNTACVQ